jgi:hypothetical protein
LIRFILFFVFLIFFKCAFSTTEIKLIRPETKEDNRYKYALKILSESLEITKKDYGNYKITFSAYSMTRDREFEELLEGVNLNVTAQPTKAKWEDKLIPIKIPIEMGLVGMRIFLIKKSNLSLLKKIKTIEDLKKLTIGSVSSWSSTQALDDQGFKTVQMPSYDALFSMFLMDRFILLPRGVNEIWDEYKSQSNEFKKNVVIDESILLYMPLPIYFFISPKEKKIANRIRTGLEALIKNGQFKKIFNDEYDKLIKKSNYKNRKFFFLKNPNVRPSLTPYYNDPNYWFLINN